MVCYREKKLTYFRVWYWYFFCVSVVFPYLVSFAFCPKTVSLIYHGNLPPDFHSPSGNSLQGPRINITKTCMGIPLPWSPWKLAFKPQNSWLNKHLKMHQEVPELNLPQSLLRKNKHVVFLHFRANLFVRAQGMPGRTISWPRCARNPPHLINLLVLQHLLHRQFSDLFASEVVFHQSFSWTTVFEGSAVEKSDMYIYCRYMYTCTLYMNTELLMVMFKSKKSPKKVPKKNTPSNWHDFTSDKYMLEDDVPFWLSLTSNFSLFVSRSFQGKPQHWLLWTCRTTAKHTRTIACYNP